jgi:dihydropyrimidinase
MKRADLIVENGVIVSPQGRYRGTITARDGRIIAISEGPSPFDADNVIDAQGRFVIPGLIDGHTHLGGKFLLEEDFLNETPGAAAGGVTTIGLMFSAARATRVYKEFTEPEDVVPWSQCFPLAREIGEEESVVDFFFTPYINTMEQADEIPKLGYEHGLTSYKIYCNLKSPKWDNIGPRWAARIGWPIPFDDGLIYHTFEQVGRLGPAGTMAIHAENTEVATLFRDRLVKEGRKDPAAWADRSPEWLEAEHIYRYSLFARKAGCRLYIVHLTSGEGLEATKEARQKGTRIIVETCPQYLTMTKFDAAGVLLKVNPPIRDRMNNEALWAGVAEGFINCLGTDHVVTSTEEKLVRGDTAGREGDPRTDIWATGSGFPGVEYSLALMVTEGVLKGRISWERLVELACAQTAYQWGLYPKKGAIQVGSDADLVIVDTESKHSVVGNVAKSRADFSIYEGMKLTGWPLYTIRRGEVIYEKGAVLAKPGSGRYLPRLPDALLYPVERDWAAE